MSAYAPMERLAAPFRGMGMGAILGGMGAAVLVFVVIGMVLRGSGIGPGDDPVSLTLILSSYALPALAVMLWMGRVQGRPPEAVLGPVSRLRQDAPVAARYTLASLTAIMVLTILAISLSGTIEPPPTEDAGRVRPLFVWLAALPFAALAVLLQSGSEEVLFRGYLMPALRARTDTPAVWLCAPAVLFGLAHVPYAESWQAGVYMFSYTALLGLALGDLTARTGSIGAAVGLHWAWNVWQFVLFAEADAPLSGFALFLHPPVAEAPMGPQTVLLVGLTVAIPWLAIRVGLRR